MPYRGLAVAVACAALFAPAVPGQVQDWLDNALIARCEQARSAVRSREWPAAVEAYHSVLTAERAWVCVLRKNPSGIYPGAAATALDEVLALPTEAWNAGEGRFGAEARAILDAARRAADPLRVEEVAFRYPFTAAGREALPLSIDLALKQGRLALAAAAFERFCRVYVSRTDTAVEATPVALDRVGRIVDAVEAVGEGEGGARVDLLRRLDAGLAALPKGPQADALSPGRARIARALGTLDAGSSAPLWWPHAGAGAGGSLPMTALERVGEWRWSYRYPATQELFLADAAPLETASDAPSPFHVAADREHFYVLDGQAVTAFDRKEGLGGTERRTAWRHYYRLPLISDANLRGPSRVDLGTGVAYVPVLDGDGVLAVTGTIPPDSSGGQTAVAGRPQLLCLDRRTGKRLWLVDVDASSAATGLAGVTFYSVPLAAAGRVVLLGIGADSRSYAVCLDRREGLFLWKTPLPVRVSGIHASPSRVGDLGVPTLAESGGRVYVNNHLGFVACLDLFTGAIRWTGASGRSREVGGPIRSRRPVAREINVITISEGLVLTSSPDSDRVVAFDAETGIARWEVEILDLHHVYGVVAGRLYVTGAFAAAIDVRQGKMLWRTDLRDRGAGGRGGLAGDGLVCPSGGRVVVLRLEDGSPVRSFSWGRANRGVGNLLLSGSEWAISTESALHVFRLNPPAADRPTAAELQRLVAALGDPDPAARESAGRELASFGVQARSALERGVQDEDAEISFRSRMLLARLQKTELLVQDR